MDGSLVLLTVEAKSNEWARQLELLVRVSGEFASLDFDCEVTYNLVIIDFFLRRLVIIW